MRDQRHVRTRDGAIGVATQPTTRLTALRTTPHTTTPRRRTTQAVLRTGNDGRAARQAPHPSMKGGTFRRSTNDQRSLVNDKRITTNDKWSAELGVREAIECLRHRARLLDLEDDRQICIAIVHGESLAAIARTLCRSARWAQVRANRLRDRLLSPAVDAVIRLSTRWPRQRQIIALDTVVRGYGQREVARRHGVSVHVVRRELQWINGAINGAINSTASHARHRADDSPGNGADFGVNDNANRNSTASLAHIASEVSP